MAVAGGLLLFLLVLGILPMGQTTRRRAVVAEVVAHGLAWGCIPLVCLYWLPQVKRILDDFGVALGAPTRFAIQLSDFMTQPLNLVFALQAIVIAVVLDGWVLHTMWRNEASKAIRNSWSLTMTAVPLLLLGLILFATLGTVFRLHLDLS